MAIYDNSEAVIGVRLSSIVFPEIIDWLRQFPICERDHQEFDILEIPALDYTVPGAPYLPVEAFISGSLDYAFFIPAYR